MATATAPRKRNKKTVVKKPVTKRTRPLLDEAQLKEEEKYYVSRGYKVVPGTICNRGEDPEHDSKFASKRSVVIQCGKRGCHEKRRIATSDLHQVEFCLPHTLEDRAQRKNEARRKATKKAAGRRRTPK